MSAQLVITLGILAVAIVLFLTDFLRPDVVALLVVVALGATGVLTPQEAFSGFANSALVTIFAIFILAEGLRRTGMTEKAGTLLLRVGSRDERRLVVIVMVAGAALSLFMNNIAAAAVLLPAVAGAARRARVNASRLLMPLAFATILGGMATLFTTTNIVVSGILRSQGLPGFGVLDFIPVGVPILLAGVAYMALWGRRRLPAQPAATSLAGAARRQQDLAQTYRLHERLFRARVLPDSYLAGQRLADNTFLRDGDLNVVAIERRQRRLPAPAVDTVLQPGDILLLEGRLEEFQATDTKSVVEVLPQSEVGEDDLQSEEIVLIEGVLAPRSGLLGATLRAVHFRDKYGMNVLGIWREGRPIRTRLGDLPLDFGDALLMQGPRKQLPVLATEPDLIVLGRGAEDVSAGVTAPQRGRLAVFIMATALVLAAIYTALIGEIMLGGALAMVLLGIVTMDQAYLAVEWRSIFLVGGMLPLGLAIANSGAAALMAGELVRVLGAAGPYALLAGLFVFTTLLTQTMHGAVVASVLAPIAIQTAQQAGLDPRSFAMAVALATSMAFLTPLGHPVNILVMGPGGYRFKDYLKVGLPLTLLLFAVVMVLLPIFWPLVPR